MEEALTSHVKLTLRFDGSGFFGPGVAELLELIEECGSIKDACAQMGLSYSKGRYILKRAETVLDFPLLEVRHGGTGGGASCITEKGKRFLTAYREWEAEVSRYAEKRFLERGSLLE